MAEIGTSMERGIAGHYATNQPSTILDDPSECLTVIDSKRLDYYANPAFLSSSSCIYISGDESINSVHKTICMEMAKRDKFDKIPLCD